MVANLNILALDVGERRVGTALANSVSRLSSPNKTMIQSNSIFDELQEIIKEQSIDLIVIGLPRNLNGQETAQTKYVRQFTKKIYDIVNIPVYFEDEALSSVRAKQALNSAKKAYKKEDIDSLAACYILDDFIANNAEVINVQKV